MPRIKTLKLTDDQRIALDKGAKYGATPSYRMRCQAILLKENPLSSLIIAQKLGCCEMSVNDWMKRFEQQGIEGLKVSKGRGRKNIIQKEDLETVKRIIKINRQRIGLIKEELEEELGKEFSHLTLRRFVKKMVVVSSGLDG
ncbi:helix-turn-helix domain-containing protein [Armatimonas sp.]|uniref:helix-turn-helix domain-containing protein n=1 Tax=Armatimonas sp. TaxID=1872638 RepID=UPI00286C33F5|nr:helix-turn-helix domain-containing protein [Armatimonas sp.]